MQTYQPETKRFVFRLIGIRGEAGMAQINDPVLKTKRTTIENEPTNTSVKRHRGDQSSKATTSQTVVAPSQTPCECRSPKKIVENDLGKGSIPDMNNVGTQIHDWESLALTHRPQYHQHQALRDLFSHYVGAGIIIILKLRGRIQNNHNLNIFFRADGSSIFGQNKNMVMQRVIFVLS
ncbi:hypothetical protein ACET3Z_022027 [Daucus carota]